MQEDIIEKLIEQFRTLPGVGYKTAQRYAFSIIEGKSERAKRFADAIIEAKEKIGFCKVCGNFTDKEICNICQKRNRKKDSGSGRRYSYIQKQPCHKHS